MSVSRRQVIANTRCDTPLRTNRILWPHHALHAQRERTQRDILHEESPLDLRKRRQVGALQDASRLRCGLADGTTPWLLRAPRVGASCAILHVRPWPALPHPGLGPPLQIARLIGGLLFDGAVFLIKDDFARAVAHVTFDKGTDPAASGLDVRIAFRATFAEASVATVVFDFKDRHKRGSVVAKPPCTSCATRWRGPKSWPLIAQLISSSRGGSPGAVSGARWMQGGTAHSGCAVAMRQRLPRPKP